MILYLKTTFDSTPRKLNAKKISLEKKNGDFVNPEEFPMYAEIEKTGIFHVKVNPMEVKRWYDSLPKDIQNKNYIIIWSNDWISIPANTIEMFSIEY